MHDRSIVNNYSTNSIEKLILKIIKSTDPAMLSYCKEYVEKNFHAFLGGKLELSLVIDAQAVLSEAIAYAKCGKSFLLDLLKSPFLKVFAPSWLKVELNKKIPEIAKKLRIQEATLMNAVSTIIENVHFVDLKSEKAYKKAITLVGRKDLKDVPYVALYFSMNSNGILTKDEHLTGIPEVRTWARPGLLGKTITIFEKGTLSFFILVEGVPAALLLLFEICVSILGILWDLISTISRSLYGIIKEGASVISQLPSWVKVAIGLTFFALLLQEEGRKAIFGALQWLISTTVALLEEFYKAVKGVVALLAPLAGIGVEMLETLYNMVDVLIIELNELRPI